MGLTIVYPIFTPLILKPIYTLLPHHYSLSVRLILLGLLIASFPLAQSLAGPIIGHLADWKGRKFSLTLALFGQAIGFTLSGLAIVLMNYPFLLLSRIVTGFFAGNLMLCLSAISDMYETDKERSKKFGTVSSIIGMSFVIAIALGGTLSDSSLDLFFNSSLPFWAMTLFSLINIAIIRMKFSETHTDKISQKHYIREGYQELWKICKGKNLKYLYGTFFFFMLGWIVSLQFLSTFLIEHFKGEKGTITLLFIGVGLAWCIGSLAVNRYLIRFIKVGQILFYSLFLSMMMLFFSSLAHSFLFFVHCILLGGLLASIAWANCLSLISKKAPSHVRGKLFGVNQSVATISMAFAPFFGGMAGEFDIRTIYLFASTSLLIATLILIIFNVKNRFIKQ
ncbi:MAG: MFS transporter [Chlamydiia bacterium]|nr:MFS transporter [Chlamydiia bacterium]